MSNDLISRSDVIKIIENEMKQKLSYVEHNAQIDILLKVKKIPTAYDVDKTVKDLEECKRIMEGPVRQDCYNEKCRVGDCTVCAFEKAIEIVKAGGINELMLSRKREEKVRMADEIKFVVIKKEDALKYLPEPMLQSLETILSTIASARARNGKIPVNEYYICNKDEPYAEMVHGVIYAGEREKERNNRL